MTMILEERKGCGMTDDSHHMMGKTDIAVAKLGIMIHFCTILVLSVTSVL
jgi:uncharacterized protein YqfB (UPF0267 family)